MPCPFDIMFSYVMNSKDTMYICKQSIISPKLRLLMWFFEMGYSVLIVPIRSVVIV